MTRVAILETGAPPTELQQQFGRYPEMFAELLGKDWLAASYDVTAGEKPVSPTIYDAYIITGSAAGVHDALPWIAPLVEFLCEARGRVRLVGICFGHQIMAHAFGGQVARAEAGWGIGLHEYDIYRAAPWIDEVDRIAVPVSHQDQVVVCPPSAKVVGGSAFTPNGMLAYEDQPAISFQFHPEFTPAYAAALIRSRAHLLPGSEAAIRSLAAANDRQRIAGWLRAFLDWPMGHHIGESFGTGAEAAKGYEV